MRGLVSNLGLSYKLTLCIVITRVVILLAWNRMHHKKTKHIDVRYHYIIDIMLKIAATENSVNMLMKLISIVKFKHCTNLIVYVVLEKYLVKAIKEDFKFRKLTQFK